MHVSAIFSSDEHLRIQEHVKNLLNNQEEFLTQETIQSPRAVGDSIQTIIERNFDQVLGEWCSEYSSQFARRAMADVAFNDKNGFYYIVDVKTHCNDTKFNMPILVSVERLTRFYEDEKNFFTILNIHYSVKNDIFLVEEVQFIPIEFLDWDCLTIGALGWGQIQIKNSNRILIRKQNRAQWMVQLCKIMLEFYPREIGKISSRNDHFQKLHAVWIEKTEKDLS